MHSQAPLSKQHLSFIIENLLYRTMQETKFVKQRNLNVRKFEVHEKTFYNGARR